MSLLQTDKYNFVKVSKIFVSSTGRESGDVFAYRVRLPRNIPNVIGASLSSYSFPKSLLPSFLREKNDSFDFRLTLTSTGLSSVFTVVWPTEFLEYSQTLSIDYNFMLRQLMQEAVFSDSTFGADGLFPVTFTVVESPLRQTTVLARGQNLDTLEFLFGTGSSINRSCHEQMGFEKADYTSTPVSIAPLFNKVKVVSPHPVNLQPNTSIDIFLKEFSEDLFARVYLDTDEIVTGDNTVSRVQILQTPIRLLQYLNIRVEVANTMVDDITENEHDMCLTVYSLAEEIEVPEWVMQSFTL